MLGRKSMKSIAISITLIFLSFNCFSQDSQDTLKTPRKSPKHKSDFWERVYFGGNLGLQFGNFTVIDISPIIGYKLTEKFSLGGGPSYIYLKDKNYNYSTSIYGGNIFGRYFLYKDLFAHTEYEVQNGDWAGTGRRFNLTNIWVGGGYRQPVGELGSFMILALWNINESIYSYYNNPVITAGFSVGF
jgi:hypothetical protein